MATQTDHLIEMLEKKGLRLVRKFNICGYFEYHVVNQADQTIAKDTVAHQAINRAINTLQA
ncbi:hypothetical protein [Acinetobacter junii]|uniref:Uncharacterized protein n=1 Tax=Acinetobacter junii TaxID=40215 RepID=A0AAW5R5J9_ACIJU|nr:hypothetical protein [Acinetobacter junii]MCU4395929.1 hypothetical protein [Acinetobacter junii]MDA3509451.1 hypothetical protein [Acinetobacter junii]MDA3533697.1 hypothetical protein [Acinetobacter junii]MDR7653704.1 hypothetical protein [Acinetobacter junii]MDU2409431.1 hypothetical protein [Acinetobacter junii]